MDIAFPITNHTFISTGDTISDGVVQVQRRRREHITLHIWNITDDTRVRVTENLQTRGRTPKKHHVFIRDYGDHAGIWRDLVALDIIDPPTHTHEPDDTDRPVIHARLSRTVLNVIDAVTGTTHKEKP